MTSASKLMRRRLTGEDGKEMKEYHPQLQGFSKFLEKYQAQEGDPIHSTAHIALPFIGKLDYELVLLGSDGTKQTVLFVTLSAPSSNYKKKDDLIVVQISRGPVPQKQTTDHTVSTLTNK